MLVMQHTYYYQTNFADENWIALKYESNCLVHIDLLPLKINKSNLLSAQPALYTSFTTYLSKFNSKPKHLLTGTEFQLNTWHALDNIPMGKTLTYADLAKKLNSHPRAIGQALKRNPLPLLYPCHRVISKTGIGGFAGETQGKLIKIKQWLLNHEKNRANI